MVMFIVWISVKTGIIADPDWLMTAAMDLVMFAVFMMMHGRALIGTVRFIFREWYMKDALRIRTR